MSRRTADDWTRAALDALADGGLAAVAVEPIAAALGATKGSFYWHFGRRADLVDAVLERWEAATAALVAELGEPETPARDRLLTLFERVFASGRLGRAELALMADRDDPAVAPVLRRVTETRLAFLERLWGELGLEAEAARSRAVFLYATYLGHLQLQALAPDLIAAKAGPLEAYRAEIVGLLADHQDACSGRPSS